MRMKNKLIDSETLKKLEQEIYQNVINSSNKNEVILKLKELKNLSTDELRDKMPWKLINKEIGLKQIVFSCITDYFAKLKLKITRNKNEAKNDGFECSKINPKKAYNLTYKYYLKPIFDNVNSDIESTLDKYKIKYVYLYPHEGAIEESGQEFDIYSSEETKRLKTQEKILGLFKVAIWVFTFGGIFKILPINFDWWIKIIMGLSVCISVNVLYNICRYYVKVCGQISVYKDKMVVETQKIINSELQPETATDLVLDKFCSMVVKRIKERDTTSIKYFKIAAIALAIILVIVSVYQSFINKDSSPLTPSHTITAIPSDKPNSPTPTEKPKLRIDDVEKYLRAKGVIPLLSKEPMPEEEIKFVEEKITGKISSITINLDLDCNSIKVIAIDDEEIIKVEATVTPKIIVNGWEIIKGHWFSNENKTLKEKYKDGLYDEVLAIYQSKPSYLSTYNEIKTRAENVAQNKIYDIITDQYPEINKVEKPLVNYRPIKIDMSGTDLK